MSHSVDKEAPQMPPERLTTAQPETQPTPQSMPSTNIKILVKENLQNSPTSRKLQNNNTNGSSDREKRIKLSHKSTDNPKTEDYPSTWELDFSREVTHSDSELQRYNT